ncbi:MAG: DUF4062 domain-containing protein [Candidatus Solibacter sp.]
MSPADSLQASPRGGKTRVFVSSTSIDMAEERGALRAALSKMGGVEFAGMEDWGARANPPVQESLREVRNSDIYIGVIGDRYGFVDESTNQSVTELEYRAAKEHGKPCLIFIRRPEQPSDDPRFLAFREDLKRDNTAGWFDTPAGLATEVLVGVHNLLPGRESSPDIQPRTPAEARAGALMAAVFDAQSFASLFQSFGLGHRYEAHRSVHDNAVRLLMLMDSRGARVRLAETLRLQFPEIGWEEALQRKSLRKWIGLAAIPVVAVAAFLAYNKLPLPFQEPWSDEFQILPQDLGNARASYEHWAQSGLWTVPSSWRIIKGDGLAPDDGALVVSGTKPGTRADLGWRRYRDFDAMFRVRFLKGNNAAWAFRTQPDGSGYVFELVSRGNRLYLDASIQSAHGVKTTPGWNRPAIGLGECCKPGDVFTVYARARGPQFDFSVELTREADDSPTAGKRIEVEPFRDRNSSFRYGNIGLLQRDQDSEAVYESWCVSPSPPKVKESPSCIPPL